MTTEAATATATTDAATTTTTTSATPPAATETKTTDAAGKTAETLTGKDAAAEATAAQAADWRKEIAGDDEKVLKDLERVTDLKSLYKMMVDNRNALRDSGRVKLLGKDATDEDRAALHKALGVPEKEDGYKLKLPEGVTLDESDKAQLSAITSYLHKRGGMAAAPDTVQAAADLFIELREAAQAEFIAKGAQFQQDSEKALRKDWGVDYAKNIAYTGPGLVALAGTDGDSIRTLQLADGGLLGDHPLFVKMLAQAGRIAGNDPIFWQATQMQGDGKSLEARKSEIMALRTSSKPGDREKYAEASKPGGELSIINARLEQVRNKGRAA